VAESAAPREAPWRRALAFVKSLDVLPTRPRPIAWRALGPKSAAGWIGALLLWAVFGWFAVDWLAHHRALLFDTRLENDDVRTSLIPFHAYGPEKALAHDPIANEMRAYVMPGIWILYRVLTPIAGIFVAPKVVQFVCIGVAIAAAVVLVRSRRAGLAPALLMLFLLMRTPYVVNRLAGGFGRSFVFPIFALWLAGAIARNERARFAAAVLGALVQPNAVATVLGAEGVLMVLEIIGKRRAVVVRRIKRFAFVLAACVVAVVPYMASQARVGHVHTLAEAERNPAFSARGRQRELPFPDPAPTFGAHILAPLAVVGTRPLPAATQLYEKHGSTYAVLVVVLLMVACASRLAPSARPALALFASTVVLYVLARVLAFRLYSPERYYSFGLPMATMALAVLALGMLGGRMRKKWRPLVRNGAAAVFMATLVAFAGNGAVPHNGLTIDQRPFAALYAFVKTLPVDARIACHPWDGDDVPWWAGRATTGGFETIQVWLVEPWQRGEKLVQETFRALYATNRDEVLSYAASHHVTHFMLNKSRYHEDFRYRAAFFEPLTSYVERLLNGVQYGELVLAEPPAGAIVYEDAHFRILDVKRLAEAWGSAASL
jgi:hypothetical protein